MSVAKTVGVLGGMGPAATLDFMAKVQALSNAKSDREHLRLLVDCNPYVPLRNEAVEGKGPSPGPMLATMARGLERAGAEFLVMPCNTAHAFVDDIKSACALPLLSIIDATVEAALRTDAPPRRIGVLAAAGCIDARLYQDAFAARGVETLVPEGEARARFMELLDRIKAADMGGEVREAMRELALGLVRGGAQGVVAGCTEVPLVLSQGDLSVPLADSTACLARATVSAARG